MKIASEKTSSYHRKTMRLLSFLFIIFCSSFGWSEGDIVQTKVTLTSDKTDRAQARQDILERAVLDLSQKYIQELIGQQKLERHRALIRNKIIKQSGKYVLLLKESPMASGEGGSSMTLDIKLSLKNLQAMLLEEGLLYRTEGVPKVLPVISYVDRVQGQAYSWWVPQMQEKSLLKQMSDLFHERFRKDLRDVGFFGLNPTFGSYGALLPASLRSESMPGDEFLAMGELFQASIIVRGQVAISANRNASEVFRLDWKLTALHSGNGRIIGEVVRSFDTDPGPIHLVVLRKTQDVVQTMSGDLAAQVVEAWRSGTFGATLLKVTLNGEMDYPQVANFKKTVTEQIKEIKSIRERLIGPGQHVFELDSSVSPDQLAQLFESRSYQGFRLQLEQKASDGVTLRVRR